MTTPSAHTQLLLDDVLAWTAQVRANLDAEIARIEQVLRQTQRPYLRVVSAEDDATRQVRPLGGSSALRPLSA